jgi:hypothetical protein
MRQFKDNAGRQWTIDVNVITIDEVKSATDGKVNLLAVHDGSLQELIARDPMLFIKTLFVLAADQVEKLGPGFTFKNFAVAIGGDAYQAARDALIGAVADFFPTQQKKLILAQLKKLNEVEAEVMTKATEETNAAVATEIVLKMLKEQSGKLPESPASIPDTLPSAA